MARNKVKRLYLERVENLRVATTATKELSGEQLVQKAGVVETLVESEVACRALASSLCPPDTPDTEKEAIDSWAQRCPSSALESFMEQVAKVREVCTQELVQSLAVATAAVHPVRFGACDGRSWKEGLAADAPFPEVAKVAAPIMKGKLAVTLRIGVATLAKAPASGKQRGQGLWVGSQRKSLMSRGESHNVWFAHLYGPVFAKVLEGVCLCLAAGTSLSYGFVRLHVPCCAPLLLSIFVCVRHQHSSVLLRPCEATPSRAEISAQGSVLQVVGVRGTIPTFRPALHVLARRSRRRSYGLLACSCPRKTSCRMPLPPCVTQC